MTDRNHTPGPWKFKDEIFANKRYVRIYGSDLVNVTDLNTYPSIPVEANARLIAAAPDLLAALEAAARFIADEVEQRGLAGSDMSDYQDEAVQALERVEAAIAKAKGE